MIERFESIDALDEFLTRPSQRLIDFMRTLDGDIVVLGIGGKMGHTLGRQAMRAIDAAGTGQKVIGVSRFSDENQRRKIEVSGVTTKQADLLDPRQVTGLPDARNVIFMAGRKFGTQGDEHLTWAMNAAVPYLVADRYKHSRIVAFSTGCVYPLVDIRHGGCSESDSVGPVGEYSMSCLGRERMFQFAAESQGTQVAIARLNYAIDMRYGVLYDIASSIKRDGTADVSVPAFNAIWQGDATDMIIRMLGVCSSPAAVYNITGPEQVSTEEAARTLAAKMNLSVSIHGGGTTALLSDPRAAIQRFGLPTVSTAQMIGWTADWVSRGGESLEKPTHFEVKDGVY